MSSGPKSAGVHVTIELTTTMDNALHRKESSCDLTCLKTDFTVVSSLCTDIIIAVHFK